MDISLHPSSIFFEYSLNSKIREEQDRQSKNAFTKFTNELVHKTEKACTLAEVADALTGKGVGKDCIRHSLTNFQDYLEVTLKNVAYELSIPLFPKRKQGNGITFVAKEHSLRQYFDLDTDPEGVADFILAVSAWMPEYYGVKERIMAAEKQRKIACSLAADLLKRTVGPKLDEKGYEHDVTWYEHNTTARIQITINKNFHMSLEVELMEDFMEQVMRIVDSLPVNQTVI